MFSLIEEPVRVGVEARPHVTRDRARMLGEPHPRRQAMGLEYDVHEARELNRVGSRQTSKTPDRHHHEKKNQLLFLTALHRRMMPAEDDPWIARDWSVEQSGGRIRR